MKQEMVSGLPCNHLLGKRYYKLVNLGYKKHLWVNHGQDEFVQGQSHIHVIESFRGFAKTSLYRFPGMSKKTFYLLSKECEFRFNHRGQDLNKLILKILRNFPLF